MNNKKKKQTLEFLCVNILSILYQMVGVEVRGYVVQREFYFTSSYFTRLPCYLISLANLAIGSVQSMAIVINVMCLFKDVGGDELTAVQGAETLAFGPPFMQHPVRKQDGFRHSGDISTEAQESGLDFLFKLFAEFVQ